MSIQQMKYVLAVDELKNFGQAADKCFITQSTLSTMIAKFEAEIGVIIFDRKTKPVTVTKEGEAIIHQLKIIVSELDNLDEIIYSIKGEISGSLKIGVIPTIAPYLLPIFLYDFVKKYQEINFVFSEITTQQIIQSLQSRELDIGIVSIPLNQPDLVEIPLYNEPFFLYDKGEPQSEKVEVANIDYDRLWLLEEGHCMRLQVENICGIHKLHKASQNFDYQSGTIGTLLKFVEKSSGATLLPYLATLDFPESDKHALFAFKDPIPVRSVGLIVHRHFAKKRMLSILEEEINNKVAPLINPIAQQKVILPY